MNVIVDTCVWSLALRRWPPHDGPAVAALLRLIDEGRAAILGPIRQELLSGIKQPSQFERLRDALRAFPDLEILAEDYEHAAADFNTCRAKGVQASNTDLLICAVAARHGAPILTTDGDFAHLGHHLPIEVLRP